LELTEFYQSGQQSSKMAAWVTDMLCNFCLVKTQKIANNSATIAAREEISTGWGSTEFYQCE
jgi:hypothetical protein